MNVEQAIDLLTAISARDFRTIGETDAEVWAHDLADVTLDEALEAARTFHRSEAATQRRILAADIVRWAALKRRNQTEWEHVDRELSTSRQAKAELYGAEPQRALPAGGLAGVDPSGGRRGEAPALAALWESALTVPCTYPRCNRQPGERCVNPFSGDAVVATKIPHNCRTKDSGHFSHA